MTAQPQRSLTDNLRVLEAVEANLAKAERIWNEMRAIIGQGVAFGEQPEYEALRAVIRGDEWRERKSIALSMTSLPEFWSSPERFEILGVYPADPFRKP